MSLKGMAQTRNGSPMGSQLEKENGHILFKLKLGMYFPFVLIQLHYELFCVCVEGGGI